MKLNRSTITFALITSAFAVTAFAGQGTPPKKFDVAPSAPQKTNAPRVFFKNLKDGASVTGEFLVEFGVEGMKIHPAGEIIEGTGHHHLIIDGKPTPQGTVVPADETHIHFGKGQTETKLKLKPGKHTLTLQFADGAHLSYGPKMSETISITVR